MSIAYEPTIGLEVHAQLNTCTKLFCRCSTDYGAPPNDNICPTCLGLPGALPSPNRQAVELAIRAGRALHCTIRGKSVFARKNYFYPDLPKGYQISQFELPLCEDGHVDIEVGGETRRIRIQRIHMEEDAAKNIHGAGQTGTTWVDYNRACTPLIEIVTHPDLRNADETEAYLKKLREILMFTQVNDGNLEEGSFRCDANVSIKPVGREELGTRAELKNINSFKFVKKAIDFEIVRQEALISGGGTVVQETRGWSEGDGKTFSMRTKEEAHDYRYFPDPDLPPLVVTEDQVARVESELPELPEAKRARWQTELGLTEYDAVVLTGHPVLATYLEDTVAALQAELNGDLKKVGKKVANFLQGEVLQHVKTDGLHGEVPVPPGGLAELLVLVENATINGKIAKDVVVEMIETGRGAKAIVEKRGLAQVTDTGAIQSEIDAIVAAHPKEVEAYRCGKENLIGFFVGQVMKATKGKANPKVVNELLRASLKG